MVLHVIKFKTHFKRTSNLIQWFYLGKKSSENTQDEAEKGEMTSLSSSDSDDEILNLPENEKKIGLESSTLKESTEA